MQQGFVPQAPPEANGAAVPGPGIGPQGTQLPSTQLFPPLSDWVYTAKRDAQEITPRVFLGPLQAGRDEQQLRRLGITHIILFRAPEERNIIKPKFASGGGATTAPGSFLIQYEIVEARDDPIENLIVKFPHVKQCIDHVLLQNFQNRVMLQGTVGMSRSAAFMIAYVGVVGMGYGLCEIRFLRFGPGSYVLSTSRVFVEFRFPCYNAWCAAAAVCENDLRYAFPPSTETVKE